MSFTCKSVRSNPNEIGKKIKYRGMNIFIFSSKMTNNVRSRKHYETLLLSLSSLFQFIWNFHFDTATSAETEPRFERASEFEHPKFSSEPSEFRAYLNLISIPIAETEQRFERASEF